MYRKDDAEQISFGDIFEAPWFFDAYLREGAQALTLEDRKNGKHGFVPRPSSIRDRYGGKDYALTFASPEDEFPVSQTSDSQAEELVAAFGNPRRAIVLSDECETDKVIKRGGRLLMATLSPWPTNDPDFEKDLREGTSSWRAFGLPPDDGLGFGGAVVDLAKTVTVWHEALPKAKRIFSLTSNEVGNFKVQWCAYGSRHGPLVALDGAKKLAEMAHIAGDEEKWKIDRRKLPLTPDEQAAYRSVARALGIAWQIEGDHLDTVSAGHERHEEATAHLESTLKLLAQLRDETTNAIEALKKLA